MTASTLKPQLRHALLSKLNTKRSGKQNALQKGFTLVELMIVIVIVGILSAIALPNFLSQSDKAKLTEAKQQSASYLKQVYAAHQEGGATEAATIPCPSNDANKYFDYTCDSSAASITATGTEDAGTNLSGASYVSTVDLSTGAISLANKSG